MKQFLSILLAVCLCLAVLAGCGAPATGNQNPGASSLPTGSSEPTGDNNTDSTGSTGTTEGNGVIDSTKPTEGNSSSASTEPTEGNGSTDSSNPTEGTPGPGSQLTGERITEEQFNALIANAPTNYSYTQTRTYNGTNTVITMLISGMEYMQTQTQNNETRKLLNIHRNDQYKTYMFNETTGKWETSNTSVSSYFPLAGFPFPFSAFTYDETIGAYRMVMSAGGMTAEIQLMFKDGQLIGIGQYSGDNEDFTSFYNYGTTVIPMPAESDIVDKENNNVQTGTSDKH